MCSAEWSFASDALPGSDCRSPVDFSLVFSSLVLSIVPSALFCFIALYRILYVRKEKVKLRRSTGSNLLWSVKIISGLFGILGNIIALAGWISQDVESAYGVAAVVLSLLAAVSPRGRIRSTPLTVLQVLALMLAHYGHSRLVRSSNFLSLSLLLVIVFDAARLRSFVLVGFLNDKPAFVAGFILSLAARVVLLAAENVPKRKFLDENTGLTLEETATPVNRWFFIWLLDILWLGWQKSNLRISDLGNPAEDSAAIYRRFEVGWEKHKTTSRHP